MFCGKKKVLFFFFPLWKISTEGPWVEAGHRADLWGRRERLARSNRLLNVIWKFREIAEPSDDVGGFSNFTIYLGLQDEFYICVLKELSITILSNDNHILGDCMCVSLWLGSDGALIPSSRTSPLYSRDFDFAYLWCPKYSQKDDFSFAFWLSATARMAAQRSRWIQPIKWLLVIVCVPVLHCCCVTLSLLKFQSFWGNSVAFPDADSKITNVKGVCALVCMCVCANDTVWHSLTYSTENCQMSLSHHCILPTV